MKLSPIALTLAATLAATALVPAAAYAKDAKPARAAEAYIPFANHGGVNDWRSNDRDTIYFEDSHRRWYKAKLFRPSSDLPFTQTIGIEPGPGDQLDKWSAVTIRGQRYPFSSFERIEGAPPKKAKKHSGKAG